MYGKPRYKNVNKLRYDFFIQKYQPKSGNLLTSVDGIDLSLLPPVEIPHICMLGEWITKHWYGILYQIITQTFKVLLAMVGHWMILET